MGREMEAMAANDPRLIGKPASVAEILRSGPIPAHMHSFDRRGFWLPPADVAPHSGNSKRKERGWYSQGQTRTCASMALLNAAHHILDRDLSPGELAFFESIFSAANKSGQARSFIWIEEDAKRFANHLGFLVCLRRDLGGIPGVWSRYNRYHKAEIDRNVAIVKKIIDTRGALVLSLFPDRYNSPQSNSRHAIALVDYRVFPSGIVEGLIVDPARGKRWMDMGDIFSEYTGERKYSPVRRVIEGIRNRRERNYVEIDRDRVRRKYLSCYLVMYPMD